MIGCWVQISNLNRLDGKVPACKFEDPKCVQRRIFFIFSIEAGNVLRRVIMTVRKQNCMETVIFKTSVWRLDRFQNEKVQFQTAFWSLSLNFFILSLNFFHPNLKNKANASGTH